MIEVRKGSLAPPAIMAASLAAYFRSRSVAPANDY